MVIAYITCSVCKVLVSFGKERRVSSKPVCEDCYRLSPEDRDAKQKVSVYPSYLKITKKSAKETAREAALAAPNEMGSRKVASSKSSAASNVPVKKRRGRPPKNREPVAVERKTGKTKYRAVSPDEV